MPHPRFIYFDLGNVLLFFDDWRSCRQMAEVAGVEAERVWEVIFSAGLKARYEIGEVDDREFHAIVSRETGTNSPFDDFHRAGCDIFTPNTSIMPVLCNLSAAGYRLGILSNTCPAHWEHCRRQYAFLNRSFDVYGLSYELTSAKPGLAIFERAANLAGVPPEEILFTDDIAGHVAGAKLAGLDAVQYTTTPQLVADLRARGVAFNY